MLTAVQAAVVAAAAAWVIGVGVAVYVMLKAARVMSDTATAVTGLRESGDVLIERANAAIDRAGEQIAKTEAVTASMAGVTATMSELDGHLTALSPAAAGGASAAGASAIAGASAAGKPLTWAAALVFGIRWAVGMRRGGRPGTVPQASRRAGPWPGREAGRRAALTGRANGTRR